MSALGLSILSTIGVLILFGSRRWALLGMMLGIMYTTQGESIVAGGFTMYPLRVLEVVGVARIAWRRELPSEGFNRLDRMLVLLYAFSVGVFLLRSDEGFAYQIGAGVDAIFLYVIFRSLLRDVQTFRWLMSAFAFMLVPYVFLVWRESVTFQNPFAAIGGVELIRSGDMWMREGRLRATGSFGHPSLLGTVGGSFLPLYVSLLFARPASKVVAVLGSVLCLAVVGASNSGGPMICVVVAMAAWATWPFRRSMKFVRRTLVVVLLGLTVAMNAPVWYVLARISSITGGDGFHRAVLLDIGFQNLDRWWLAGMPARETRNWLPYTNTATGFVDMTNNFLAFGVTSGLGAMFLLIALLTVAYSLLGRAMTALRTQPTPDENLEPIYWGMGAMLTVHAFNWFGITYWDQSNAIWFLHLALISSLAGQLGGAPQTSSGDADAGSPIGDRDAQRPSSSWADDEPRDVRRPVRRA